MPSVTLAESAKLSQDMLISGVIETVITVDQFFSVLPFETMEGNALAYNREKALGDAGFYGVGDTITSKSASTFDKITESLTKIIGDAEVDEMIQASRSQINNQKAVQIASKAKSVGRAFSSNLIVGDGTGNTFKGLQSLVADSQTVEVGGVLTFEVLDELLDKVIDKDGEVDFITMNSRELRKYYTLLRALGGATIGDVVTLPDGSQVPGYRGTPIFRNNNIPINQGTGTNESTIYAGNFDDGTRKVGISGFHPTNSAGIAVQDIGISETKDESITRVKWYCGLANYSELGLAAATAIVPAP